MKCYGHDWTPEGQFNRYYCSVHDMFFVEKESRFAIFGRPVGEYLEASGRGLAGEGEE